MTEKPILVIDESGCGSSIVEKLSAYCPVAYYGPSASVAGIKKVGVLSRWSQADPSLVIVLSGGALKDLDFLRKQGLPIMGTLPNADQLSDPAFKMHFCKQADLDYTKKNVQGLSCTVGGLFNGQRFMGSWVGIEHKGLMDGEVGPVTEGMGSLLVVPSASIAFTRYLQKAAGELSTLKYLGPFSITCCVNDEGYWLESINSGFVQPSFDVWTSLLYEPLSMALFSAIKQETHLEVRDDLWALGVCLAKPGYPYVSVYQAVRAPIIGWDEAVGDHCQILSGSTTIDKGVRYTGSLGRVITLIGHGNTITAAHSRKTHCIHGHVFDAENTKIIRTPWGIGRQCRTCSNNRKRIYRAEFSK